VNVRKIIDRTIRRRDEGVDVVADVNAVIAANVNESGGHTHVSNRQRIVQRSGKTVVSDGETTDTGGRDEQ
jgi:hypothetical protein